MRTVSTNLLHSTSHREFQTHPPNDKRSFEAFPPDEPLPYAQTPKSFRVETPSPKPPSLPRPFEVSHGAEGPSLSHAKTRGERSGRKMTRRELESSVGVFSRHGPFGYIESRLLRKVMGEFVAELGFGPPEEAVLSQQLAGLRKLDRNVVTFDEFKLIAKNMYL